MVGSTVAGKQILYGLNCHGLTWHDDIREPHLPSDGHTSVKNHRVFFPDLLNLSSQQLQRDDQSYKRKDAWCSRLWMEGVWSIILLPCFSEKGDAFGFLVLYPWIGMSCKFDPCHTSCALVCFLSWAGLLYPHPANTVSGKNGNVPLQSALQWGKHGYQGKYEDNEARDQSLHELQLNYKMTSRWWPSPELGNSHNNSVNSLLQ